MHSSCKIFFASKSSFADNEDPVLTCPDNVIQNLPDGQQNDTVTWPAPQVIDNSGESLDAVSSHINGSSVFLNNMEETVVYNATDSSNNVGYCNFTVLLKGTLNFEQIFHLMYISEMIC